MKLLPSNTREKDTVMTRFPIYIIETAIRFAFVLGALAVTGSIFAQLPIA